MKLADLRTRITIQSKQQTVDGIGGRTTTWTNDATVWANITPASGSLRYRAERLEENITHVITIRHRDGVDASKRLMFGSRTFAIKSAINKDEGKETWLVLHVVEGDPS